MECEVCGEEIEPHKHAGRPRKYCKICAVIQKRKYDKGYNRKLRWYKQDKQESLLGTISFSPHRCKDFKQEYLEIQEYKKHLFSGYKAYGSRRKHLRHKFLSTEENEYE